MGLLQCADCGAKISDQAASCPHCGRPRFVEGPSQPKTALGVARGGFAVVCLLAAIPFTLGGLLWTFNPTGLPIENGPGPALLGVAAVLWLYVAYVAVRGRR